jgi:hypothetical protein
VDRSEEQRRERPSWDRQARRSQSWQFASDCRSAASHTAQTGPVITMQIALCLCNNDCIQFAKTTLHDALRGRRAAIALSRCCPTWERAEDDRPTVARNRAVIGGRQLLGVSPRHMHAGVGRANLGTARSSTKARGQVALRLPVSRQPAMLDAMGSRSRTFSRSTARCWDCPGSRGRAEVVKTRPEDESRAGWELIKDIASRRPSDPERADTEQ